MEKIKVALELIAIVVAVFLAYSVKGIYKEIRNPLNMDEYEKKHNLPRLP